ncbi:MAG: FkbM family methyltransferase [Thermoanaerobaculia bacterium]
MLDLLALFARYRLEARGVIHVGAHEGQELPVYRAMGFRSILLIEANPDVFARLRAGVTADSGAELAHCAVSDHEGLAALHLTTFDQSSSLLRLKLHRELYPEIEACGVVSVPMRRLDSLLAERPGGAADFNLLVLDVQGAELLALRGAEGSLTGFDAVLSEINFAELYEGGALADELDTFLAERGFRRVATACGDHPSWGDALYLRPVHAPTAPERKPNAGTFA